MRQLDYMGLVRTGMGVVLFLAAAGCATSSDLERLEQGLAKKLEAQSKASQAEMSGLRMKLEIVQTAQEKQQRELVRKLDEIWSMVRTEGDVIGTQVGVIQNQTTAVLDEVKKSEAATGEVRSQLNSVQRGLSTVSGNMERIAPLLTTVGGELRSLAQTLLGAYSLEEAALRDRLKGLEQLRRQLEPGAVPQQAGIMPAK